jgi:hypothetical protein
VRVGADHRRLWMCTPPTSVNSEAKGASMARVTHAGASASAIGRTQLRRRAGRAGSGCFDCSLAAMLLWYKKPRAPIKIYARGVVSYFIFPVRRKCALKSGK